MRYAQLGLLVNESARVTPGYVAYSEIAGTRVFIIDMDGEVVHQWAFDDAVGVSFQLLPDGHLMISHRTTEGPPLRDGKCGRMVEVDWDGNVVWEHIDHAQHHDVRRLDNGNTIYVAWEPLAEAKAKELQGGVPGSEANGVTYADVIREVDATGALVWEWRLQDQEVANLVLCPLCGRNEFAHCNSLSPQPNGDILANFRRLNTIMLIDRQSGDVKWEMRDNQWGHQHDSHFLDNGNILMFANGVHITPAQPHSRLLEIDPKTRDVVWEYLGSPRWTLFSSITSSVDRLPNGGHLVAEGMWGRIFELSPDEEIVWEYISPHFVPARGTEVNAIFRAVKLPADAPEFGGRLPPLMN